MNKHSLPRLSFVCLLTVTLASAAIAGTRARVEPDLFAPLQAPTKRGVPVEIRNLPLIDRDSTILVDEFDVMAPGAVIEVADKDGKRHRVTPQPIRQFRGAVKGDPESIVFLAVTRGKLEGFVMARDKKFSIWSTTGSRAVPRESAEPTDVYVEEMSSDAMNDGGFMCDVEKMKIGATPQGLPKSLATSELNAKVDTAPTGTQKTVLNLAIVADDELYANFSSNAVNEETFLRNLVAATSTIYFRDLGTEIRIPYLLINTGGDPFTVVPGAAGTWNGNAVTYSTLHALLEYGDYWHNTPPSAVLRSAEALISGKTQRAGVAWIQQTCASDFFCTGGNCGSADANGHWAGGYSYNGGIGLTAGERSVPNPDANPNYNAPGSSYWPLLELAHEFGHNVQSSHTHCVQLSAGDQVTYGRVYVDNCYAGEGGCYAGVTGLPPDGAGNKGTIMSYCHLLAGGGNNMRYTFGQVGEASHRVLDLMRARLDTITPSGLSTITAPSSVPPGVGGQAASVTNTAGLTFDWTITNGTFTGGGTTATGASVTFTGTTNPVTLKVYATSNSSGCGIMDTKSVTVGSAGPNAPTNVVATATSSSNVNVTWTPVPGLSGSYNVYRSTDNTTFSLAGNVLSPPFNDGGRSANTAYMYKVRATNGTESVDSNKDYAVTTIFTDGTLTAQSTSIKAVHFTELRTAVNALRTLNAGQGAFSFTDAVLNSSVSVKGLHMTELRTQLNAVRTVFGFSTLTFTDTITITTQIKKVHMDELRAGVQ